MLGKCQFLPCVFKANIRVQRHVSKEMFDQRHLCRRGNVRPIDPWKGVPFFCLVAPASRRFRNQFAARASCG